MDIVELYVLIDDFCKKFMPKYIMLLKKNGLKTRAREGNLSISEIVLILLLFSQSGYKCFKWFYINELSVEYKDYFKRLVSYTRFVDLIPRSLPVLFRFLQYSMYMTRKNSNDIE